MMSEKKSKTKQSSAKNSGFGLALWVVAAIILFVLFVVNQGKIVSNLKATGFFGRVFGKTPAFVENAPSVTNTEIEKNDVAPGDTSQIDLGVFTSPSRPEVKEDEEEPSSEPINESTFTPLAGETVNIKLFFMSINSDGSVTKHEVTRAMIKSGSPLVDALKALIDGPSIEEQQLGCRTLVSSGTKLISASVKDGTAYLNFSGEFEFNQYGIEGTRGQLQQIVYTATAFPTVENVQFYVDGEHREYLSGEGVWIGTPLSRSSF